MAYGLDFPNEQVGLFPGAEMATMSGFAPMEDISETPLGQPSGGTGYLPRKDRATGGHIDGVLCCLPLLERRCLATCRRQWDERWDEVQAEQPVWIVQSQARRDAGAPVAAARNESRITQALHELCPCLCYSVHTPALSSGLAAEAISGQRRHHQVEIGVRQPFHRLLEFEERPGPAVCKE